MGSPAATRSSTAPARATLVLTALILVETVANLNLTVANVALPDIGRAFDASQTELNLVAICYSLGLASSVLYLGAVGDRYGRRMMLLLGVVLSIPACLVAAFAPSIEVLIAGRLLGGISAGMAYPTTLALITALWSGPARTKSIALWSGIGGSMNALGPMAAGLLLMSFEWRSVFLITLPLAAVALVLSAKAIPGNVNETTDPVDHPGGLLSAVMVASIVMAINFVMVPGQLKFGLVIGGVGVVAGIAFFIRQKRIRFPLFDLRYAARPTFWVAATAGMIVFGSLMGAMFIGQQFMQNVLDYSTLAAGCAILPGAAAMVVTAPQSAKVIEAKGSRFTLLLGYCFCLAGFLVMLVLFGEGTPYWQVAISFILIGAGVGFAGTPASRSLTGSVPVGRVGMASGTADLQRDLGGAVMQSILGAILTAGYALEFSKTIAGSPQASSISESVQSELEKSFSSASLTAERYPQYSDQIVAAAKQSFVQGQALAYTVGVVAIAIGAIIVWRFFPDHERELKLLDEFAKEDTAGAESDPA